MTPHRIVKSFRGSQDGIHTRNFAADTVEPLSDSLAAIAVKQGWAHPAAEARETKVVQPEEVKAGDTAPIPELAAPEPIRTTLTLDPAKRKRKG